MRRFGQTRFWVGSTVTALLCLFVVLPVQAQEEVLPNCERTLYKVELNGELACPSDGTNACIEADDYVESIHGEIEGVMVNRSCGFNDFIQLFVNLANWGLGIMAVLAMFFYIYGGFQFLIAGGRKDYIEQGKRVLWGTTMGVIIMLTAWAVIGFYIVATTGSNQGYVFPNTDFVAQWFGQNDSCRQNYIKNYDQSQCGQNNLHLNCSDPIDGSAGPITRAQTLLTQRECNPGGVDGCFGSATEDALKTFQRVNWRTGIAQDGVVNTDDWEALLNTASAYNCTAKLGCCMSPDFAFCYEQVPEPYCNQTGWVFIEGMCPDNGCEDPS